MLIPKISMKMLSLLLLVFISICEVYLLISLENHGYRVARSFSTALDVDDDDDDITLFS